MPGPLPDPNAIRRNAPTIPTTDLPASGRTTPAPDVPSWITLGEAGLAWWEWAWHTPQACGWSDGNLVTVAHRASLEDVLQGDEKSRVSIIKEMREADARLGLTPKGMADLRWRVVDDTPADSAPRDGAVASLTDRRARLTSAS
jgi:hypothetical protein